MELQSDLSLNLNKAQIGKSYKAIVDTYDYNKQAYIVRNYAYAPDDVDGCIYINSPYTSNIKPGDIIEIEIIDGNEYDLIATKKCL